MDHGGQWLCLDRPSSRDRSLGAERPKSLPLTCNNGAADGSKNVCQRRRQNGSWLSIAVSRKRRPAGTGPSLLSVARCAWPYAKSAPPGPKDAYHGRLQSDDRDTRCVSFRADIYATTRANQKIS